MCIARAVRIALAVCFAVAGAGAPARAGVPAAMSVTVVSVTTPVPRGAQARLVVRTAPYAQCGAAVHSQGDRRTIASLPPQTADGSGLVTFTHRVPGLAKPGPYPVTVSCRGRGQTAAAQLLVTVR